MAMSFEMTPKRDENMQGLGGGNGKTSLRPRGATDLDRVPCALRDFKAFRRGEVFVDRRFRDRPRGERPALRRCGSAEGGQGHPQSHHPACYPLDQA